MQNFALILAGVLLNAFAQIALKQGMRQIGYFTFTLDNVLPIGLRVVVNPYVLAGLSCYVASVVFWLLVLSRVPVSLAYPMLSIGYIVTAVFAYFAFGENLSAIRIAGIVLIIAGVFLLSRS